MSSILHQTDYVWDSVNGSGYLFCVSAQFKAQTGATAGFEFRTWTQQHASGHPFGTKNNSVGRPWPRVRALQYTN